MSAESTKIAQNSSDNTSTGQKSTGRIIASTAQEYVSISLDGQPAGTTGIDRYLAIDNILLGPHVIVMEKEDYTTISRWFQLTSSTQPYWFSENLQPSKGSILVRSIPWGNPTGVGLPEGVASVYLNNEFKGYAGSYSSGESPVSIAHLDPGTYNIKVSLRSYYLDWEQAVTVQAGVCAGVNAWLLRDPRSFIHDDSQDPSTPLSPTE